MTLKKILDVTDELALFYNATNGHHSIRTLKFFAINSILHGFSAKEFVASPTYLSVQIDIDKHIHLSPDYLQYINHSCNPNIFFDTHNNQITAIKDIAENEEISFFYPSTEWQMAQAFDCFCGHNNCLGTIAGAVNLSKAQLQHYKINPHILAMLEIL
jgi:hypothetical protein